MTTDVGRRFAAATGMLSMAMLAASAANYALNLALARLLDPASFGDATLMVTLLLGLTAAGVALQLISARQVSAASPSDGVAVRRRLGRRAGQAGVALAAATAVAAPALQTLFQTGSALPFVILALGLPVYLVQSVDRGVLQGRLQFGHLAASFAVEALVRLLGGIILVWSGLGVIGATAALSLSFLASWLAMRPALLAIVPATEDLVVDNPSLTAASRATVVLLVGQIIINNGDVVLAKQVLDPETAGSYAAVALVGRAVFFASWAVTSAAFPFMSGSSDARRVLRMAMGMVLTMSVIAVSAIAAVGDGLALLLFGSDLSATAHLFVPYAIATAMFAVANLIATLDVGRDRVDTAICVLGGGIIQTVLLLRSGDNPTGLVNAQLSAMAVVLVATVAVHAWRPRTADAPRPAIAEAMV